jgi:Tetratricopeptide repeat
MVSDNAGRDRGGGNMSIMTANSGITQYLLDCGRHSEAEALFDEVQAIREKKLGLKHPDTLTSMDNLAFAYHWQRRYDKTQTP